MLPVEPLRELPAGGTCKAKPFPKGHKVVIGEELHHVIPELLSVTVLKLPTRKLLSN
ncbi:MAG: hypothetical protein WC314_25060 [Vulcanimicrobiota bacterium]